jgi:hypothetical protein
MPWQGRCGTRLNMRHHPIQAGGADHASLVEVMSASMACGWCFTVLKLVCRACCSLQEWGAGGAGQPSWGVC